MNIGKVSPRARAYVRKRGTDVMEAKVRIERVAAGQFNLGDLLVSSGSRSTIYEGKARLWEVSGMGAVQLGNDDIIVQSSYLSIPWDFVPQDEWPASSWPPTTLPRVEDEFVVLEHKTDFAMVGRRGVIRDTIQSGILRNTRKFSIQLVQASEEDR